MELKINKIWFETIRDLLNKYISVKFVAIFSSLLSMGAIVFNLLNDYIVRYGDSESHLNIAKRVTDSITPGFAQLGGIWLPVPHILMLPFVWSDTLWRTGLAGALVSGLAFVVATVFIYKAGLLITKNKVASFAASLVFALNPNALYMQSTPMTEMLLIAFFMLSSYYFIKFLLDKNQLSSLLLAAFFGFCSVLTRYDGWFLVGIEMGVIFLYYFPWRRVSFSPRKLALYLKSDEGKKMEGYIVIFSTLAFLGVILWLAWDFLILGDPLYFTNSEFSAKSQQDDWRSKGQLPAYHNLPLSLLYYFVTSMSNAGVMIFFPALLGVLYYLSNKLNSQRWLIGLVLGVPFIFNVLTLYIGQSVIFIPHLTPYTFDHTLFNVRYGLMILPLLSLGWGYLFSISKYSGKFLLIGLFVLQFGLYYVGYSQVITWQDGTSGLSSAQRPPAEQWIKQNYDNGLVLMDDYARTVSVVRSGVAMENMIYIGNKPYWEESLVAPDKHIKWIVMQENDAVWGSLWQIPARRARLDKYFEKVYQSEKAPNISIFKKKENSVASEEVESPTFWNHQCIDTMKYSRDASREFISRTDTDVFINNELQLIKDIGANCIAIGTPYDEEFVPILTKWVSSARAHGLTVWFRGNMSGWEGWFDYPKYTDPAQHHAGVSNLITKHPELFETGDIFTPAPEPENGILGDPRFSEENKKNFLKFLPESYSNCASVFKEIKKDVKCGYFSVNGDVASEIFTKKLLVDVGDVLVIDHYVKEPKQLVKDIQEYNKDMDALVMLGEIGGPIPDIHGAMNEEQQAEYISELMQNLYEQQDILLGLNYWVLRGGSTSLINEDGTPRQAYYRVKDYFSPAEVKGVIKDTLGKPISGLKITVGNQNVETTTNENGEYSLLVPARETEVKLESDGYTGEKSFIVNLVSAAQTTKDFVIEPEQKSLMYKIKLWWKNLRN